jgi:hypothetical protein
MRQMVPPMVAPDIGDVNGVETAVAAGEGVLEAHLTDVAQPDHSSTHRPSGAAGWELG